MPNLPQKKCSGCGACVQVCPRTALLLKPNYEGFLYPAVDSSVCVECRICEKTCPVLSENKSEKFSQRKSYAAFCNDEKIRFESSSGGLFSVLAGKIAGDGGIVFGAEFDSDFSVKLGFADSRQDISRFTGSKYVQARTEQTFKQCRNFLEEGKKVLYTGTPCQIAGLKSFLRKEYENLFTVDVICHGTPSPELWQKYIKYREKKSASRTVKTAFRRKNDGWKQYSLSFTFANDSEYCRSLGRDKYLQLFLKDNALRESCYDCSFRGDNHKSDITLADFWGIENILPEFFDDKGTSLVIIQNEKGKNLLESVKNDLRLERTDFYKSVSFNPSYFKSVKRSKRRDLFYKNFNKHGIDYLYRRFAKESLLHRTKLFIKRAVLFCAKKLIGKENASKLKQKIKNFTQRGKSEND